MLGMRLASTISVLLVCVSLSNADGGPRVRKVDGAGASVAARNGSDALLLCVSASSGRKLNGEFGVAMSWPASEAAGWRDFSPKLVETGTEVMSSPILIRLDRANGVPSTVKVEVGVCVDGGCDIATFEVVAPVSTTVVREQGFCGR